MSDKPITVNFHDLTENQAGQIIVRRVGDNVAICVTLEEDGDIEVLVERKTVEKLNQALVSVIE